MNTICDENLLLINRFSLHSCFSHTLCNPDWNMKSAETCTSTQYPRVCQFVHQSLAFPSLRESISPFS